MDRRVKKLLIQLLLPLVGGAAVGTFLLSGSDAGVHKKLFIAGGTGAGASGASALFLYARNRRLKYKRQPGIQIVKAASAVIPPPRPVFNLPSNPRLAISVLRNEGAVVVIASNLTSKNSRKVLRRKLKEIQAVTWTEQTTQSESPAKVLKRAGNFSVSLSEQDFEEEVAVKLLALGAQYNGKETMDWFSLNP